SMPFTGTSGSLSIPKTSINTAQAQVIQLSATGVSGGSSPVQQSTALFLPPLLSTLATTSSQINASWNAPAISGAASLKFSYRLAV
ncbi:hypothetical protein NK983_31250, partial [Salmonella enterica subsp. enterica serovar Typhimurium]|nr:hypothetical protein [Salmonella enterica subsp. enterica serovar Typhimurium]